MYTLIWQKYLPVIRILLKRAAKEEQTLQLNTSDFEKTAAARKTSLAFTLLYHNGRPDRLSGLPVAGKDLATVLQEDPAIRELFRGGEYQLSMNKKMLLTIQCTRTVVEEVHSVQADETPAQEG
jgi:hypothetical protein